MASWAKLGFQMNPWATGNGTMAAPKRRKRRTSSKAAAPKRRKRATSSKRPARLVKGSAAAKRYMASIRKRKR